MLVSGMGYLPYGVSGMKCFVEFDISACIIEVPDEVGYRIKKHRTQFLKWLYDKKNKHKYWTKGIDASGEEFIGVCYGIDAFVEWLNKRAIKGKYAPAVVVERDLCVDQCPDGMMRIFF